MDRRAFTRVGGPSTLGVAVVMSLVAALGVALALPASAQPSRSPVPKGSGAAHSLPADAQVARSQATGAIRFLVLDAGQARAVAGAGTAADVAAGFFAANGRDVGMDDPSEARLESSSVDASGADLLTFVQVHAGLPVFHTMLKVRVAAGAVTSVSGTWVPGIALDTTPTIGAAEASRRAVRTSAAAPDATVSELPVLGIHRDGLLDDTAGGAARLAYQVRVNDAVAGVAEDVYVDARDGSVIDRVERDPHALNRAVFDANDRRVWVEGDADPIVAPAGATPADVAEWQQAIDHAASFYNLLGSISGPDGPRGAGQQMSSHMQRACRNNAFTDGASVFVCAGSATDDVIAHEWGHVLSVAVTGFMSSDVEESFADVWGETVDQLNGSGVDQPATDRSDDCPSADDPEQSNVRWKIAEDLGFTFRDMWNPICVGGIGKASDGYDPDGEPHAMAALGNHAFARAVDGGTYGGVALTPLGITKAVNIWWAAEQLMFPGATYADLAIALTSACSSLVGVDLPALSVTSPGRRSSGQVVSADDCADVEAIIDVVEMRDAHPPLLLEQTISFAPISDQVIGSAPITLTATASSGLPVSFTTPTPAVCAVVNGRLVIVAEGVCAVFATQDGSDEWAAAPPVGNQFIVGVLIGELHPTPGERVKKGAVVTVSFQLFDVRGRKVTPSRIEVALMFVGSDAPVAMSYNPKSKTFSSSFTARGSVGTETPVEVGVGADGWFVGGAVTSVVVKK
jgi:Zn-dependent metalloprotease